jgi:hypothetical protein
MRNDVPSFAETAKQYAVTEREAFLVVEKSRLLTGEYLYAICKAYRAFIASIALHLAICRDQGKFQPWWEYDHVLNLLRTVLDDDEWNEFKTLRIGRYVWVIRAMEGKFLSMAGEILDGQRAATDAFEQARQIQRAAESALPKKQET